MTKNAIGIYGVLVNAPLIIFNLLLYFTKEIFVPLPFLLATSAYLVLSSYVIYYFVASYYVQRRQGINGIMLFDTVLAVVLEALILVLGCTLHGLYTVATSLQESNVRLFEAFWGTSLIGALWMAAAFGLQLLVIGILSGGLGWYLLRKPRTVAA